MKTIIDTSYFNELSAKNPVDICRRALCNYNAEDETYTLSLWSSDYIIQPEQQTISAKDGDKASDHEYFSLFIIYYLLNAKAVKLSGEWISDKDIPGGTTFFRGPHEIPTQLICKRFKNDIDAFAKQCESLQGTAVDMADAAFTFTIAPRIVVTVLYWVGDEDFPAEAKILYDKSITSHLSLDIVFALAVEICTRIGR